MTRCLAIAVLLIAAGCRPAPSTACPPLPERPGAKSLYASNPMPERAQWLVEDAQRLYRQHVGPALARRAPSGIPAPSLHFPAADHHGDVFSAYADARTGCILLPVSSLLFLRDLMLATAWHETQSAGSTAVRDYLLMMRARWPDRVDSDRYQPLNALAVPDDALDDPKVKRLYGDLSTSVLLFLLAHEGAHIHRHHAGNRETSAADSRRREIEADRIALDVMRDLGYPPVGVAILMSHVAMLQPPGADAATSTHPTSPERIRAISTRLQQDTAAYSDHAADPAAQARTIDAIRTRLNQLADLLDDRGMTATLGSIGSTMTLDRLIPGRAVPARHCGHAFCGAHIGDWRLGNGLMKVELVVTGPADALTGQIRAWLPEDPGAAMTGAFNGSVRDQRMHVKLHLGGRQTNAVFRREADGSLTGSHGNDGAETGAGTFRLTPSPG